MPRITEDTADSNQFLIIYFKYVAAAHRFAEYFFRIESLTKIDIENLDLIFSIRHGVQKTLNSSTTHGTALSQRTETNSTGGKGPDVSNHP